MKFEIFLLVLFVLSADTDANDKEDGRPLALPKFPVPQYTKDGEIEWFPRIIGGTPAALGEFPGHVSVQTTEGQHICGGTLINEYNVLTAAHCVTAEVSGEPQALTPSSLLIMGGNIGTSFSNPSLTRQFRNVVFVFYHPSYSPITLVHDIAILRLIHPFANTPELHPVDFSSVTPTPGTICRLAGWGATDKDGPNSIVLQRVNVNVIANNVCNGHQELNGLIVDGMVCADSYACQGDSGGGLICNDLVSGVVSFGNGCNRPNSPDVYTDLSFYNAWIGEVYLRSDGASIFASVGLITFLTILVQNIK